ncbi:hsp70 nucleotide exchange factor fes1 [Chytriomyces hyalinus]|nr:hsp70 nucleotide exchange factor fes1 [Chytriomyces hyalinus]
MSAVDEKTGTFASRPVTSSDLLQWAVINNATKKEDAPYQANPVKHEPIDPKWVDVILGKSDSVRMKECVDILQDNTKDLDEKLTAFDELEMLVESLDNANDMRNLGLWKPILTILKEDQETEMRVFAAWVLGTCVQNNPPAQKDFVAADGLPILLHALSKDKDSEVVAKCMTCLSGLVRQNPSVYEQLAIVAADGSKMGLKPVLNILTKSATATLLKAQKRAVFFLDGLIGGTSGEEEVVVGKAVEDALAQDWAAAIGDLLDSNSSLDKDLFEKCMSLLVHLADKKAISAVTLNTLKKTMPALTKQFGEGEEELDAELAAAFKRVFV